MDKELASIFETSTSFYHSSGRWLDGKITLTPIFVEFTETDKQSQDDMYRIAIPLSEISSIEKKQSSLIYPSIVIWVKSTCYWFSSFSNRDSIFHLLELFWREYLLCGRREFRHFSSGLLSSFGQTKLGNELLGMLSESEKNLALAGCSLERQGHQLRAAEDSVDMIHGDLSVAENIMSAMSIKPVNSTSKTKEFSSAPTNHKCSESWNVVFAPDASANNVWHPGIIQFKEKELSIVDDKNQIKYSYNHNDVTSVQVVSPWQLRIHKKESANSNGFEIMCPGLSKALSKFIEVYKEKMSFLEGYPSSPLPKSHSSSDGLQSDSLDEQLLQSTSSVSAEEIKELSAIITNLRSLASEIGREQHAQMERIDNLITTVEKADLRMKSDVHIMKKKI